MLLLLKTPLKVPESVGNLKNPTIQFSPESEIRVQAVSPKTVGDVSDDSGVSSGKDSTLMMDVASPPDDILKHANQRLNKMLLGVHGDAKKVDDKRETIVTVDLWDFAGQHLYYASHPVFLSSRAVYVLVHNLSKALDAPAQPCVRQGTRDIFLENPNSETNLENLLSWLVTIHSIRPTGEEIIDNSGGILPYLRPPVFIVGTHADKPFEDIETTTSKIQDAIAGKEYEKHVIRPFFSIDNNRSWLRKVKKLFAGNFCFFFCWTTDSAYFEKTGSTRLIANICICFMYKLYQVKRIGQTCRILLDTGHALHRIDVVFFMGGTVLIHLEFILR